ncbi:MAG: hypothetical protein AAFR81_08205 [Chloroflexota bacterium]
MSDQTKQGTGIFDRLNLTVVFVASLATIFACGVTLLSFLDDNRFIIINPPTPTPLPTVPPPPQISLAIQSVEAFNISDDIWTQSGYGSDELFLQYGMREIGVTGEQTTNAVFDTWEQDNVEARDSFSTGFELLALTITRGNSVQVFIQLQELDQTAANTTRLEDACDDFQDGWSILGCFIETGLTDNTDDLIGSVNLTLSERELSNYTLASSTEQRFYWTTGDSAVDYDVTYRLQYQP